MCHLFSQNMDTQRSQGNVGSGNCVIGTGKADVKITRPNFVFFYPDTVRANLMSTYGYPLKSTPNLDAFVEQEAIAFDS